jgi:PAS domain S-box-containing protein
MPERLEVFKGARNAGYLNPEGADRPLKSLRRESLIGAEGAESVKLETQLVLSDSGVERLDSFPGRRPELAAPTLSAETPGLHAAPIGSRVPGGGRERMPNAMSGLAEAIVATIAQALLVLDADLRVLSANCAFYRQFGVAPEATEGRLVYDLGNGQWNIPGLRRLLSELLSGQNAVENYRVEHEFEQIGQRIMLLNGRRIERKDGDLILLAVSDVTERERQRHELEGQREFGEKLIDSIREALLVLTWDLRVRSANKTFYEAFAVSPEETRDCFIYDLGNGQWDIPELRRLLEEILPERSSFDDFEVAHEFEGLGRRVMLLNGRRLDHLDLIILAIRDVTEERANQQRERALMGELQHRVKNVLSNVHALAMHTRRSSKDLDEFLATFQARLGALARTQDLLLSTPSGEIGLHEIVRSELQAVGAAEGREFTIDGPAVRLSPRHAQAMALAVHELTTNAGKYGALSSAAGSVRVSWRIERNGQRTLAFSWRERGVPVEAAERREGFGTQMIERSVPQMLGGAADLSFHPDGAACEITFALP